MKNLAMKCHSFGKTYQNPHFFVLCKGENSGKPLNEPCANCFVVFCDDMFQRDYLFWLSWGMWQAKYFHTYLIGSCIEFIRIRDYKRCMEIEYSLSLEQMSDTIKAIDLMRSLANKEVEIKKQIKLLKDARMFIFYKKIKAR